MYVKFRENKKIQIISKVVFRLHSLLRIDQIDMLYFYTVTSYLYTLIKGVGRRYSWRVNTRTYMRTFTRSFRKIQYMDG